ncbi:MAG: DeoR/GlpR transcriptional regulator [Actinobacteria bacterium]|nr:DeoR/GlpR transcriptional regulator [Actinomycetota bacterium]
MLGEERREYILNQIKKTGSVNAIDIARTLNVSEATIRRDLNRLSRKGLARRTYGGAMAIIPVGTEMKFNTQKEKFIDEKKRIALAASRLIEGNDVIMIEAGTTGIQIALNISSIKNLTVITNSCDIATLLAKTNPEFNIILSGGILRTETHSLIGPIADYSLSSINVDKAFIGITGIDITKGITATDHIEAQTKKRIIECAKKVIALCDHSKLGHISVNCVAPVNKIDVLITDSEADKDFIQKIRNLDIEVIIK